MIARMICVPETRTAMPPCPDITPMTSGEPHSEARAKTADWRYAVDRARRSVRMISRGRRKLGVVEAR